MAIFPFHFPDFRKGAMAKLAHRVYTRLYIALYTRLYIALYTRLYRHQ